MMLGEKNSFFQWLACWVDLGAILVPKYGRHGFVIWSVQVIPAPRRGPDRTMFGSARLSLTNKLAALHRRHLPDPGSSMLSTDIADLTTNLRNNIWQKITILDAGRPSKATYSDREYR